jgi:hypothetical protein
MKAQIDENIAPALAKALDCLAEESGHNVVHVTDMHARGTPDTELFLRAADFGIDIHVTHDHHHRNQDEREALSESKLIVFVLEKSWMPHSFFEKASRLVHWWPRLVQGSAGLKRPGMYVVPWRSESRRFTRVA